MKGCSVPSAFGEVNLKPSSCCLAHNLSEFVGSGNPHAFQASEVPQQLRHSFISHARRLAEFRGKPVGVSPGPMKGYGEPVSLITDLLDDVQNRRELVQHD